MQSVLRKPLLMALVAFNFFVGKCYIAVVFTALEQLLPADGMLGIAIFDPLWASVAMALAASYAGVYFSLSHVKAEVESALKVAVGKDIPFVPALNKLTATFLVPALYRAISSRASQAG